MTAPLQNLPIVDLKALAGAPLAEAIGRACRDIGFFYVVNHDVAPALMRAAFAQSAALFASPLAEKQALAIEKIGGNRGYSGLKHEALDPAKGADLKEAFNIGLELAADDPDLLARKPFRTRNAWPAVPGFRDTVLGYFNACTALALDLHRAFAGDFGLPRDYFTDKFSKPMTTLRLLHYPAGTAAGEIGAGEHTDYGNITLLATDDVGGLEVRTRAGDWISAAPLENALIVNIGDCLMRWTNDVYVSTPHRVINRSGRERYSIAFFFDPNPEAMVAAIESCVAAGAAPL
jgi:isopenicillin N synthase-like dioxygenase